MDFDSGNLFFCFSPMNTRNIFIEKKSVVCTHAIIIAQKSWFFPLMLLLSFQAITAACKWLLNGVEILANIGRTFFYPTWFWWPHLFWLSGWIGLQFLLEQSWVCTILYELRFLWSLQSFTLLKRLRLKTGKNIQWWSSNVLRRPQKNNLVLFWHY